MRLSLNSALRQEQFHVVLRTALVDLILGFLAPNLVTAAVVVYTIA